MQASACVCCPGRVSEAADSPGFVNPRWVAKRQRQRVRHLAALYRDEKVEPLVAPVASPSAGRVIDVIVDSGAEESVAPPGLFAEEVVPSPMSREGRSFRAANGTPIENFGQMIAHFQDADGRRCGIPFQVAAVVNPLVSVSRMVAAGCRVTFQSDKGEIVHEASGRRLPIVRRNGAYVLEMHVGPPPEKPASGRQPVTPPFPRQGR